MQLTFKKLELLWITVVSIIKKTCNVTCYNDKQVFLKHQIGNLETWKIIF